MQPSSTAIGSEEVLSKETSLRHIIYHQQLMVLQLLFWIKYQELLQQELIAHK